MRMKEDALLNGQLKPAYNLQHGVDSKYVTWLDVFPAPTATGYQREVTIYECKSCDSCLN